MKKVKKETRIHPEVGFTTPREEKSSSTPYQLIGHLTPNYRTIVVFSDVQDIFSFLL